MERKKVLVCGNANFEVSVALRPRENWPLPYEPSVRSDGLTSAVVAGVGVNVASALTVLGYKVRFASIIGKDPLGEAVKVELRRRDISDSLVRQQMNQTPQSVVIYNSERRQARTDLKTLRTEVYPAEQFSQALQGIAFAVMTNVYYSSPLLDLVVESGVPFVTDLQNVSDIHDVYNEKFMQKASVLFMSNESLPKPNQPAAWLREMYAEYQTPIIIAGMGARGAMICVNGDRPVYFPAVEVRPPVNSIGAGDALCSAFVHCLLNQGRNVDPYLALKKAMLFASWKIGESGGSVGFLTSNQLEELAGRYGRAKTGFASRPQSPLTDLLRRHLADTGIANVPNRSMGNGKGI